MSTTKTAYWVGLALTVASLAYVALDQLVLGNLDEHLHEVYDPYGKYGQAGALYAYLYGLGVVGVISWLWTLRHLRDGGGTKASVILAVLAALPVLATVSIQEYGSMVIPLHLGIGYVLAWVSGLIGTVALLRTKVSAAASAR